MWSDNASKSFGSVTFLTFISYRTQNFQLQNLSLSFGIILLSVNSKAFQELKTKAEQVSLMLIRILEKKLV